MTDHKKFGANDLERKRIWELFGDHHRNIKALLGEAEAALKCADRSGANALARVRWNLMRRLRNYQLFKHNEIFDPIIRDNETKQKGVASRMKRRCIEIGDLYNDHVKKWSYRGMESDWTNYKGEAALISVKIRNHLDREFAETEDLLHATLKYDEPVKTLKVPARKLRKFAQNIVIARREIGCFLDPSLFSDPAFDILLILLAVECEPSPTKISALVRLANVPPTTALRWIRLLESRGLVTSACDSSVEIERSVSLTKSCREAIYTYLDQVMTIGRDPVDL